MDTGLPPHDAPQGVVAVLLWLAVGAVSGIASMLNKILNKEAQFHFGRILARGFVGSVVGATMAWIVNIKWGYDYAIPAASICSWFSTESMTLVQHMIERRLESQRGEDL